MEVCSPPQVQPATVPRVSQLSETTNLERYLSNRPLSKYNTSTRPTIQEASPLQTSGLRKCPPSIDSNASRITSDSSGTALTARSQAGLVSITFSQFFQQASFRSEAWFRCFGISNLGDCSHFSYFLHFFLQLNRNLKFREQKASCHNRRVRRARKREAEASLQIILKTQGVGGWKEWGLNERLNLSSLVNKSFFSFGSSRFLLTGIEHGKWILQQ